MSYDEYSRNTMTALDRAMEASTPEDERTEVAKAQVWATLALAEAIREGLAALSR